MLLAVRPLRIAWEAARLDLVNSRQKIAIADTAGRVDAATPRATVKLPLQNFRFRMIVLPRPATSCVIDWSDHLEQAAADMHRAVIVSIFGDHLPLTTDETKETMAVCFSLYRATLEAKHVGDDIFFVFVSDEDTGAMVVDASPSTGSVGSVGLVI